MKPNRSAVLQAARNYLLEGLYVVPIPGGLNHPTITGWQELRLTKQKLPQYFEYAAGVGLLLHPSKLIDVDIDCREALAAANVLLPPTAMVHGRRGNPESHRFYCRTSDVNNVLFEDPRKPTEERRRMIIEIRAKGQTVVPPSRHSHTGELLKWHSEGKPARVNADDLRRAVAQVAAAALLGRYWPVGSRHRATLALAGLLFRSGWDRVRVEKFVLAVGMAADDEETQSRLRDVLSTENRIDEGEPATGTPTLVEIIGDDVVGKVREWLELKSEDVDAEHYSDLGNAHRLIKKNGHDLLYCISRGKWLLWDGTRWSADESGKVERLAKEVVLSISFEANKLPDANARKALFRHATYSESEPRIRSMINLAQTEPGVPVGLDQLDADPWLLNCLNGTIDLRTGKLLSHNRKNLCTKRIPVAYDPDAPCPMWKSFLDRILAGKCPLINFLQRAIGYSLTGITSEQVLLLLYGTGANGKSTFIETIRKLLGDYGQQADFSTFLERKNDGPRNDLARLNGARFVAAVEAGTGRRLAENVIKQVTGSDKIAARYLYHEYFEFSPQFKLFLVANHKPRIVGTDEAIWRRIRLLPFEVTIPPNERDKQLIDKLERELDGILAWAVRGCLKWQEKGIGDPEVVSNATATYRQEMDIVGNFIDERCVTGNIESENAGMLYLQFKEWCESNGEDALTPKDFGTQLGERGFDSGKKRGNRCWHGLRLRREHDKF